MRKCEESPAFLLLVIYKRSQRGMRTMRYYILEFAALIFNYSALLYFKMLQVKHNSQ